MRKRFWVMETSRLLNVSPISNNGTETTISRAALIHTLANLSDPGVIAMFLVRLSSTHPLNPPTPNHPHPHPPTPTPTHPPTTTQVYERTMTTNPITARLALRDSMEAVGMVFSASSPRPDTFDSAITSALALLSQLELDEHPQTNFLVSFISSLPKAKKRDRSGRKWGGGFKTEPFGGAFLPHSHVPSVESTSSLSYSRQANPPPSSSSPAAASSSASASASTVTANSPSSSSPPPSSSRPALPLGHQFRTKEKSRSTSAATRLAERLTSPSSSSAKSSATTTATTIKAGPSSQDMAPPMQGWSSSGRDPFSLSAEENGDKVQPVEYALTPGDRAELHSVINMPEVQSAGFYHVTQLRMAYYATHIMSREYVVTMGLLEKIVQTPLVAPAEISPACVGNLNNATGAIPLLTTADAATRSDLVTVLSLLRQLPIEVRFSIYRCLVPPSRAVPPVRAVDECLGMSPTLYFLVDDALDELERSIRSISAGVVLAMLPEDAPGPQKAGWAKYIQTLLASCICLGYNTDGRKHISTLNVAGRHEMTTAILGVFASDASFGELVSLPAPSRTLHGGKGSPDDPLELLRFVVTSPDEHSLLVNGELTTQVVALEHGVNTTVMAILAKLAGWTPDSSGQCLFSPPKDLSAVPNARPSTVVLPPLTVVGPLRHPSSTFTVQTLPKSVQTVLVRIAGVLTEFNPISVRQDAEGAAVAEYPSVEQALEAAQSLHGLLLPQHDCVLRVCFIPTTSPPS